jgi:hypothetical protein
MKVKGGASMHQALAQSSGVRESGESRLAHMKIPDMRNHEVVKRPLVRLLVIA